MDQKTRQFDCSDQSRKTEWPFALQNESTICTKRFLISKAASSWMKDSEIPCANFRGSSFNFTITSQDKREFFCVMETTGSGGYFMINNSIRLKSDGDEVEQDGRIRIVNCKCLMEVSICEDAVQDFFVKGSFQSQIYKGKDTTVSVRFRAKEFLDKVASLSFWHLCVVIKIELSITPSTQWSSLGTVSPVIGMEPPFTAALRSKAFADVTIECDGKIFQAHKNILSCASPVFAQMLESSMIEASTKKIKIHDLDSLTVERMLDFIYTGNFTRLPDDALVDQLFCAEKYDLKDLKAAALLHMVLTASDFNVMKFLNAAMKYNASNDVVHKFTQHCRRNFQSLSTLEGFREFFAKNFDQFVCNHRSPGTHNHIM